jgi:hypothetical protein
VSDGNFYVIGISDNCLDQTIAKRINICFPFVACFMMMSMDRLCSVKW